VDGQTWTALGETRCSRLRAVLPLADGTGDDKALYEVDEGFVYEVGGWHVAPSHRLMPPNYCLLH